LVLCFNTLISFNYLILLHLFVLQIRILKVYEEQGLQERTLNSFILLTNLQIQVVEYLQEVKESFMSIVSLCLLFKRTFAISLFLLSLRTNLTYFHLIIQKCKDLMLYSYLKWNTSCYQTYFYSISFVKQIISQAATHCPN
jgi:hypothetical protein